MPVDPNAVINTANLLLSVTGKLLDKLPDYPQAKRKQFYKLKKSYDVEMTALPKLRDDQKIDELWEELARFISAFDQEINAKIEEEKKDEK